MCSCLLVARVWIRQDLIDAGHARRCGERHTSQDVKDLCERVQWKQNSPQNRVRFQIRCRTWSMSCNLARNVLDVLCSLQLRSKPVQDVRYTSRNLAYSSSRLFCVLNGARLRGTLLEIDSMVCEDIPHQMSRLLIQIKLRSCVESCGIGQLHYFLYLRRTIL